MIWFFFPSFKIWKTNFHGRKQYILFIISSGKCCSVFLLIILGWSFYFIFFILLIFCFVFYNLSSHCMRLIWGKYLPVRDFFTTFLVLLLLSLSLLLLHGITIITCSLSFSPCPSSIYKVKHHLKGEKKRDNKKLTLSWYVNFFWYLVNCWIWGMLQNRSWNNITKDNVYLRFIF